MKKNILTILPCLILSIMLGGCGDPLNQKVSELTGTQRNALAQQLTPDDLKVFLSYMKRQTTVNASSQESRESATVKQAINEEREWIFHEESKVVSELQKETEKRKQADQAKLKDNYHVKEMASLINNSINYKLVDKDNTEGQYSQPYISFGLLFENKTEKNITYIDGVLTIKNELGRKIKDVAFIYDDENNPIGTKKSINYKARLKINTRDPDDSELSAITFEVIKSSILINEIRFQDKSKLKMPDQK